jgi:23S rRNA (uracil1939-C5)-methyltransferase
VGRVYDRQLADKRDLVAHALGATLGAGAAALVRPLVAAPAREGYRVQAKLAVSATRCGPRIGLYEPRTHRVLDTSGCPLHDPLIQAAIPAVRDALVAERLPIHGPARSGVRYLLLRASVSERKLMVTLVTSRPRLRLAGFVRRLRGALPLSGLLLNENRTSGNVIVGPRLVPIWGEAVLRERYGAVELAGSPLAFVQANTRMAERIYGAILAAAGLAGHERVLDLYCGLGGIALTLASRAGAVVGIEEVDAAIAAARENARRNRARNARFQSGRVEARLADALGDRVDLVTLNPPRKGCGDRVARAIAAARVARVLYLSCAPDSFARDAAAFVAGGYRLRGVQPFDLLPQTEHVEVLGWFERVERGRRT